MLGVYVFGFRDHPQSLVIAAGGDAGGAALAKIGDEDGEDAAGAGRLALRRGEDGVHLLVGHGNFFEDGEELELGFRGEAVNRFRDFAENGGQRGSGLCVGNHSLAGLALDLGQRGQ